MIFDISIVIITAFKKISIFKLSLYFLRHNGIAHLIDYSMGVNIIFICVGKPKTACDLLFYDIYFTTALCSRTCSVSQVSV